MLLAVLRLITIPALLPFSADTPPSLRVPPPAPRELRAVDDVVLTARMADGTRAPSTIVLPSLANRRDVFAYLLAHFPDTVKLGRPTVMPVAWVYVDESGGTHFPELLVPSGVPAFDTLAIELVKRARFAPAHVDRAVVPVWVMLPVQLGSASLSGPPSAPGDPDAPHFTPYTVKPVLINRDVVSRALVREYPPELSSARVGGTVLVWLRIDEQGAVTRALVKQGSNSSALDAAALRVAGIMRFTPAENKGRKTAVWISVPVVFRTE
jgi:TonB family protein